VLATQKRGSISGRGTIRPVDWEEYASNALKSFAEATTAGELAQPRWLYLTFPNGWHYDVLRILDYLRDAGVTPDDRTTEALDILASKRDEDGRWPLEHSFPDELLVDLGEREDEPSRWITLKALRVLRWAEEAGRAPVSSAASS
jgi:hypothetical protein